jgi:phage terminase large subunit-like protein
VRLELDPEALKRLPLAERREAEAKLGVLKGAMEGNPLWAYDPHFKQREFHGAPQQIRAFMGGNRSGKSHGGVMDDLIQVCDRDAIPPWLQPFKRWEPPCYGRIVAPDFTAAIEGVILEKLRHLAPKHQLLDGQWRKAYDSRRRRLWFENGSWIDFLSYEQELDKHGGAALHFVHFDEEPGGDKGRRLYEENLMRLVDFGGHMILTFTPLMGLSWSYHELTRMGEPRTDDEIYCVVVDMDDNPHLDDKSRKRMLARMQTDEVRAARKSGRFVHFAGLIYPEFDPQRHVVPQALPSPDAKIYVGIDPGIRYQAAVVWVALEPSGEMVVFHEIAVKGHHTAQIAAMIHAANGQFTTSMKEAYGDHYEYEVTGYIIDPSARNTSLQTGRSDQMEYIAHGIPTMPGQNSHSLGFTRVKARLASDPPRLLITANCDTLIQQFREYRWKTPQNKAEGDAREEPVKKNDHALDALRYVISSELVLPLLDQPDPYDGVHPADRAFQESIRDLGRSRRHNRRHPVGGGVFA